MIRALNLLSSAIVGLAMLSVLLMLLLIISDVAARAVLNTAIPGVDTIVASYLMVAIIFLPLAMLHILEENIVVAVLHDRVPNIMKDLFDIVAHALALGFYALVGWVYFKVAIESFEIREYVTGTWDVPIWPARVFMPLGLFLGAIVAGSKLILTIRDLVTGAFTPHNTIRAVDYE